jgi:hypothetical protein
MNAFGSVTYELILLVTHQRNFPKWTQNTVEDMYRGASTVELKGN